MNQKHLAMKTKLLNRLLLTLLCAVFSTQVNAQSVGDTFFAANGIEYRISSISTKGISTVSAIEYDNDYTEAMRSVVIPSFVIHSGKSYNVTSIWTSAFAYNNLTSVVIGDNVTSIGDKAFSNNDLTFIIIDNAVKTIGDNAFEENALTNVTIGNSVTSIGDYAFHDNAIKTLFIGNAVESIGVAAFSNNDLTNITIPNSITIIREGTFYNNDLRSVTIPSSVTFIQNYAFDKNPNLLDITSESKTPEYLYSGVFSSKAKATLTIPAGSRLNYIDQNWIGFFSVVEDSSLSINDVTLSNQLSILTNANTLTVVSHAISIEQIEVYAITGAKVAFDTGNQITINSLNTGIYIAKIYTDNGIATKKFIKR